MMSLTRLNGPEEAAAYYGRIAEVEYYTAGESPSVTWGGGAAEILGVVGQEAKTADLEAAFRGYAPGSLDPNGDPVRLARNAGSPHRRAGYDLTFSVDKSVSTLWSQAGPETREMIEQAINAAHDDAMSYVGAFAAQSRSGRGGVVKVRPSGLLYARTMHTRSRGEDPQLHIHTVVVNTAACQDGIWRTLESRPFFQQQHAIGAVFRTALADELRKRLGVRVERYTSEGLAKRDPSRQDLSRIRLPDEFQSGFERAQCEFSTRANQIKECLDNLGIEATAQAKEMAALGTRNAKTSGISQVALDTSWVARGKEVGFGPDEARTALEYFKPHIDGPDGETPAEVRASVISEALTRLSDTRSVFREAHLLRELAIAAQGRIGWHELKVTIRQAMQTSELVHLRSGLYTTRTMLQAEREAAHAAVSRAQERFAINQRKRAAILKTSKMNAGQRLAFEHFTEPDGGLKVVQGLAGAGKTYLSKYVVDAYRKSGYTVHACAISGKAAAGFRDETGVKEASTIASMLKAIKTGDLKLCRADVLFIEEAGMVDSRSLRALLVHAKEGGARVLMIGDSGQIGPVSSGMLFRHLAETVGTVETREVMRQREDWQAAAGVDVRDGHADRAIEQYRNRGRVAVHRDDACAMEAIVQDWWDTCQAELRHRPDHRSVIMASTNAQVDRLNVLARERMRRVGLLGGASVNVAGTEITQGDRIVFRRNDRETGVMNGDFGMVESISGTQLGVRLDSGHQVTIDTASYQDIRHGYASTVHSQQGATVDHAFMFVGSDSRLDRNLGYVQMSRHKSDLRIHVSQELVLDDISALAEERYASGGAITRVECDDLAIRGLIKGLQIQPDYATSLDWLSENQDEASSESHDYELPDNWTTKLESMLSAEREARILELDAQLNEITQREQLTQKRLLDAQRQERLDRIEDIVRMDERPSLGVDMYRLAWAEVCEGLGAMADVEKVDIETTLRLSADHSDEVIAGWLEVASPGAVGYKKGHYGKRVLEAAEQLRRERLTKLQPSQAKRQKKARPSLSRTRRGENGNQSQDLDIGG